MAGQQRHVSSRGNLAAAHGPLLERASAAFLALVADDIYPTPLASPCILVCSGRPARLAYDANGASSIRRAILLN